MICMDFGEALAALKKGERVCRSGWNGKGMWVAHSPGCFALPSSNFWAGPNRVYAERNGGAAEVGACLTFKAADGVIEMGWRPTSRDMLADDWRVLAESEL